MVACCILILGLHVQLVFSERKTMWDYFMFRRKTSTWNISQDSFLTIISLHFLFLLHFLKRKVIVTLFIKRSIQANDICFTYIKFSSVLWIVRILANFIIINNCMVIASQYIILNTLFFQRCVSLHLCVIWRNLKA